MLAAVTAAAPPLLFCRRLKLGNLALLALLALLAYLYYLHRLMRRQISDQALMAQHMQAEMRENMRAMQEYCMETIDAGFRAMEQRGHVRPEDGPMPDAPPHAATEDDSDAEEDERREEEQIRNMLWGLNIVEEGDEDEGEEGPSVVVTELGPEHPEHPEKDDVDEKDEKDEKTEADETPQVDETDKKNEVVETPQVDEKDEKGEKGERPPPQEKLHDMKYQDLKRKAAALGLDSKGTKDVLIATLTQFLDARGG